MRSAAGVTPATMRRPPCACSPPAHRRIALIATEDGTSGIIRMLSTTTAFVEPATFGHSSSMRATSANSPTPA